MPQGKNGFHQGSTRNKCEAVLRRTNPPAVAQAVADGGKDSMRRLNGDYVQGPLAVSFVFFGTLVAGVSLCLFPGSYDMQEGVFLPRRVPETRVGLSTPNTGSP